MWLSYVGAEMTQHMRILLVEDEKAVARRIRKSLTARCSAKVDVACSRDTAIELANRDVDYDLIVCDLRIPTAKGGLDLSVDHGIYLHDTLRKVHSGTPCVVFSGFATLENMRQRLADGPTVDLFGTRKSRRLVYVQRKSEEPEFLERATELSAELRELDGLDMEHPEDMMISKYISRPLRWFARRLGGTRLVVSALGGLSGARVFRCDILDSQSSVGLVVAKVDLIAEVQSEIERYRQYVAPALEVGAFAPLADEVLYGCGRYGAAFYKLAADGYRDLFELVANKVTDAASAVSRLQNDLNSWKVHRSQFTGSIGDLRSERVSDEQLGAFVDDLDEMSWQTVESVNLTVPQVVQHGDLHGRNVIVGTEGNPLIIDYGDVGLDSAVLDAVTLELSLLFHMDRPDSGGWPTLEQASNWFQLEEYVSGSPVGNVVIACREWARSVGTRLELAAIVYCHTVRQLKYDDTDKALVLAIAKAAVDEIIAASKTAAP